MTNKQIMIGGAAALALLGLVVWKRKRDQAAKTSAAANPATAPIDPAWWTMAGSWRGSV